MELMEPLNKYQTQTLKHCFLYFWNKWR